MRYFADLHIHSRFARATSKNLTVPVLDEFARQKGITVLGTGDFTHPNWLAELQTELEPAPEAGLYVRKQTPPETATRFLLSVEISSIYNKNNQTRRIHTLVMFPSFEAVKKFNNQLINRGANLRSDGRPIVGLSAKAVAELAFATDTHTMVIPAHAWTPWFAVFGSASGFDSLEECFEDLTPRIVAIETGLSSDPPMNWQLSTLDKIALISSSDAHSPQKIGREATELDGELSYAGIREAFNNGAPLKSQQRASSPTKLIGTIEFYPEEGKYHYDGHRLCKLRWSPQERMAHQGRCSVCGRPVTIGVLSRVESLADRNLGFKPEGAPSYRSLVPLEEIVAEALGASTGTKGVQNCYQELIHTFNNELKVLIDTPLEALQAVTSPIVVEGIKRVREGNLHIEPGYDGEYGTVHVFSSEERQQFAEKSTPQASLF